MPNLDYIYLILIIPCILVVMIVCIRNHKEFANFLKEKRKPAVTFLIFFIIIIDIILGAIIYINSSYTSETYSYYDLESIRLQDSNNNSMSISFTAYFHSEGPISSNNPIILDKIHFHSFITDYIEDNDIIHIIPTNNIINLSNSDLTLYFSLHSFDSAVPSNEHYTISMTQVDSYNKSYYFKPTTDDVTGSLILSGEGNARINCWGGLVVNGETYNFFDQSNTDEKMFTLQPTSEYLEYKNNQISMALIVIAVITFSLPASIKVITELYWGKEKEATPNDTNKDNELNNHKE